MCDIGLGQVECLAMEYSQAYVYFYKAYRSRYLCLGAEHSLTLSAKDNALQLRNITGERIINGMELKDRIIELEWYEEEIHSFQYSIAVFIARLSDDDCLTLKQLKQLIKAAVNFSISRLACTLDLEPQSPRKVKSSIDSLTMLLMFSALPASSPTKKQKLEKSFEVFDDFTGDYPYESATDSGTEKLPQKPISEESTIMVESPIILPVKDAITPTESMGKNESNQSRFKIRSQAAVMVAGSDATFTRPEKSRKSSIVRRQSSVLMGNAITKRPTNQNHTLSLYELPLAIKRKPFVFLRDFDQKLVTVKILSMKEALNTLGPKLFAIGVMQWLVKRNFFISKDKSTKPVDAMYQQIIVPAVVPTVVPIIASGNDEEPESVKTTLLGRIKNSQLVLSAGVDEFPPVPPPLPTVWPPEVFTGASAEISSDGIAAASSEVKGPKMKQVFLHSLSSVDGTLWAEPVDVQIPVYFCHTYHR